MYKRQAEQCFAKAHYLAARITSLPGFKMVNPGEFFHEFVTTSPVLSLIHIYAKNTGTAKAGAPAKKGSPSAAETKPASEDKKPAAETKNSQLTDEEKNWVEK